MTVGTGLYLWSIAVQDMTGLGTYIGRSSVVERGAHSLHVGMPATTVAVKYQIPSI